MKLRTTENMTYMRMQLMGKMGKNEEELSAETYHDTINNEAIYSLHMEVCCIDVLAFDKKENVFHKCLR